MDIFKRTGSHFLTHADFGCCDGVHNLGDIASELNQRAHVSMDVAMKDVRNAITYFQNEGLLRSK